MSQKTPLRSEIAIEHTWNLDAIFGSIDEWEDAVDVLKQKIEAIQTYQGTLNQSADHLSTFLKELDAVNSLIGKIYVYASLQYAVDTGNQELAARQSQARALFGQIAAATAFTAPELIAIGFDTLKVWMDGHDALRQYRHQLDQLKKMQKYVRSTEVEELLGMVQDAFGTASATHGILANTDMEFKTAVDKDGNEYDITQGSVRGLYQDDDRELRRTAWQNYHDLHLDFKNTMANALAAGVKQNVFNARARGYDSALDAAMKESHIPEAVFHNLINTFKDNLSTWHKYWEVRRKALGYKTLHEWDIWASLSHQMPQVGYKQAVEWITEGMRPLGDEYADTLRRGALEERWVDIYPNQGKRMGAFSSGVQGTYPYIMMSYTDDLFGLSTLAHELGHSMHSYLTWKTQKTLSYTRYGLFVAEVASNFNQAMVRDYLFRTQPDPEFQIAVIEEAMSNFYRYFFIMPTLARFEHAIHQRIEQGEALSADYLIDLLAGFFKEGYGNALQMDHERSGVVWATFHTHLYSNFYVYKYATGISGAHALAKRILDGETGAAQKYIDFLKAGGSVYPLEALKIAGVDLASPRPVQETFAVLATLVDRLERLIEMR